MVSKHSFFEMQCKRMHCDPMELRQAMPVETTSFLWEQDAVDINLMLSQGFQSGFGSLGNGFRINAMALLGQVDHACLSFNVVNKFATNSHKAKLGFIGVKLDLKRRLPGPKLKHLIKDVGVDGVRASDLQTTESCSINGRQAKGKNAHKLSELSVTDFGAAVVPFPSAISRS